ncbi:MAG: exonuclease SbcCD subunit D C-terminal domain-containing protein, partial [Psittacicella sp.]
EDELIIIEDQKEKVIILAVPFLKESELIEVIPGESLRDKNQRYTGAMAEHYNTLLKEALIIKESSLKDTSIIAMGHFFMTGGEFNSKEDRKRDLIIGSLDSVRFDNISKGIDYFALGHIHTGSLINKDPTIRYSSSPIPLSFGELKSAHKFITFNTLSVKNSIKEIILPMFQRIVEIEGNAQEIQEKIGKYTSYQDSTWIKLKITGKDIVENVNQLIDPIIQNSNIEILEIDNKAYIDSLTKVLDLKDLTRDLKSLTPEDIFQEKLKSVDILDEDNVLGELFLEALREVKAEEYENIRN